MAGAPPGSSTVPPRASAGYLRRLHSPITYTNRCALLSRAVRWPRPRRNARRRRDSAEPHSVDPPPLFCVAVTRAHLACGAQLQRPRETPGAQHRVHPTFEFVGFSKKGFRNGFKNWFKCLVNVYIKLCCSKMYETNFVMLLVTRSIC